ncbi:MAG: glycosyltransferase family 4 protein, partial [Candidatus Micrarchaeota archaeon]
MQKRAGAKSASYVFGEKPHRAVQKTSRKLSVVQAVHAFPPDIGGIETHVYNLSLTLAKDGHKVIVHTSQNADAKEGDAALSKKGVIVKRHFAIQIPGFSSVKIIPFLCLHLALENADIYHTHGFGALTPFQAALASLALRKKFFWTIHGIPKFSGIKKIFLAAYTLKATFPLVVASKIICVSDSAKFGLPKFAQKKAIIIPNGISEIFFSKRAVNKKGCSCVPLKSGSLHLPQKTPLGGAAHWERDNFKILFAGRLDASKGIFMLADAFKNFRKTHNACLCFNGPDEGRSKQKLLDFASK